MAFGLAAGEQLGPGLRRILLEQVDDARSLLAGDGDFNETVHEARKDFKKSRAVLRFGRGALDSPERRSINALLRDLGRSLSDLRDTGALVECFDATVSHFDETVGENLFPSLRASLIKGRDSTSEDARVVERLFANVADGLAELRPKAEALSFEGDGFEVVDGGLRRTFKDGRRALATALIEVEDEPFHEFRKRSKDLWYHLRIFKPAWPRVHKALVKEAHQLTDLLGDDHDLVVLRAEMIDGDFDPGEADGLLDLIAQRSRLLRSEALRLGRRLYAGKPSAYRDRLEAAWSVWHEESGPTNAGDAEAIASVYA